MRGFLSTKNPQMRECYKRLRMRHACGSRREQSTLNDYSNIFEFFCTCTIFHVQFFFFLFWPASFVVAVAAAIFFSLCIVPVRASLLFNITGSSPASSFKKKSFKIISQSKMDKSPFTSAVLQSLNYGTLIINTCSSRMNINYEHCYALLSGVDISFSKHYLPCCIYVRNSYRRHSLYTSLWMTLAQYCWSFLILFVFLNRRKK